MPDAHTPVRAADLLTLAALPGTGEQLSRCAVRDYWPLAEIYADCIDWHQIAQLMRRGCPPGLALRIVG